MYEYIARVLAVFLCWKILWLFAFYTTGVYVGYVSINNGVLLNNVHFCRGIRLSASSIRWRLWGNSRKLVISDLEVILPKSSKASKTNTERSGFSDAPVSLYPSSKLLKWLLKLTLSIVRRADIELKDSKLEHEKIIAEAKSVLFVFQSRSSPEDPHIRDIECLLSVLNVSMKYTLIASDRLLNTRTSSALLSLSVDKQSGRLSNIVSRLYIDEAEIDFFHVIRSLMLSLEAGSSVSFASRQSSKQESLKCKIERFTNLHKKLSVSLKEISINVVSLCARGIPVIPASIDCTLSEYLNLDMVGKTLYTSIDAASLHLQRLLPSSAGFDIHFNSSRDLPLHATFSSLLFKAGFESKKAKESLSSSSALQNEFLSVPNYSFTLKTNAPSHLVHGLGFKNSLFETFLSVNSPVLDVDHYQLAILTYNYKLWERVLKVRALKRHAEASRTSHTLSEDENISNVSVTTENKFSENPPSKSHLQDFVDKDLMLDKAMFLLRDFFPRMNAKLTIEQPRILIRVQRADSEKIQMLMVSYSLMVIHVLTTKEQDYDAECYVTRPNVSFGEKSTSKSSAHTLNDEICGVLDAKVILRIMKDLKVETKIRINGAFIDLTKLDVLNGLHDIISHTSSRIAKNSSESFIFSLYDGIIRKSKEDHSAFDGGQGEGKATDTKFFLFRPLPAWFVSLNLQILKSRLQVGSVSPLLPLDLISKLSCPETGIFEKTNDVLSFEVGALTINADKKEALQKCAFPSPVSSFTSSPQCQNFEDFPAELYWSVSFQISNFKLDFNNSHKHSTMLYIPIVSQNITAVSRGTGDKLISEVYVKLVRINLDRHSIFAMFGLVFLVSNTIVSPLKQLHRQIKEEKKSFDKDTQLLRNSFFINYIIFSLKMEELDMVLALSPIFEMRIQAFNSKFNNDNNVSTIWNEFLRAMVNSSSSAHHWDRVLCIDSLHAKIGDPIENQYVVLQTRFIRFIQPHRFVVYKLFDNLSVFIKVLKHLARCFKRKNDERVVLPKESSPIVPVGIHLTAKKISFTVEDDPFDSELNMIFQLGLVEQRKRLEHLSIFDRRCEQNSLSLKDKQHALSNLYKIFERLWVRKIRTYKYELENEILMNKCFLYGDETDVLLSEDKRLKPYSLHPPLLSVLLVGVNLDISKPKFSLSELPDFIFQHGQGVPRDTRYNLMIPTYLNLKLEELRMHLRDYPLPLFHLPHAKSPDGIGKALNMSGHLIICESLILDEKHLRNVEVQLTDVCNDEESQFNVFDMLTIKKSLSTVKIYTDMNLLFDSSSPSRFVWGQSYQFGIQQIMITLDQFSKPPVDPSPKLGFWDKLRLVVHGKLLIKTGLAASIEVAFKGGQDPYNLFGESNGFILGFQNSVVWHINEHDDPSSFFNIQAENLSWYIPNYPSSALVCWTRKSSKAIYLPSQESFITSCHGYYLNKSVKPPSIPRLKICEKEVVELSGGVNFSVGFLLERLTSDEDAVSTKGKSHHNIQLYNPAYASAGHDSYKGFRSDRLHMAISLKAHTSKSYNTIHLSPGVLRQFLSWWRLFRGNMMIPIRKGRLFQEKDASQKFSKHLFSNKFLFDIGDLFIGHVIQRVETDPLSDQYSCVGLRAKVKHFLVDLHQNKEEVLDIHKDLSRRKKILKMRFNLGQISLSKIDLRSVSATFLREIYKQQQQQQQQQPKAAKEFLETFDDDEKWFDSRDYSECFQPSIGDVKSAKILPLLHSDAFAYIRDTTNGNYSKSSLSSSMHLCTLGDDSYKSSEIDLYNQRVKELSELTLQNEYGATIPVSERIGVLKSLISNCERGLGDFSRKNSITSIKKENNESFHNTFLLVSMFLKWNEQIRNQVMKYLHFVQFNSNRKKFLSFRFINLLENLIARQNKSNEEISLATSKLELMTPEEESIGAKDVFQNSQERFDNFDKIIEETLSFEKIVEDYKIEIISPQIQFHSEELKDSVVMITAPSLESKILSVVYDKEDQLLNDPNILEKRYGVILHNAILLVIDKNDMKTKSHTFESSPYGTKTAWPPFLGIETCQSHKFASQENVLAEKISLMLTFTRVLESSTSIEALDMTKGDTISENKPDLSTNGADKLRIDVPQISINCTSEQYFSLYTTLLSLILYIEPLAAELREKVRKLNFSIDFQDYCAVRDRLKEFNDNLGMTKELLKNYSFRQNGQLNNENLNDYLLLAESSTSFETEIVLMLQTIFLGDIITETVSRVVQDWRVAADKVAVHMLNDDRSHIIDLTIHQGVYNRSLRDDGFNYNRIEVTNIDGRTFIPNSQFEKFLGPINPPKNNRLVTVDWSMHRSVGGIKIIENLDINLLPLNVRIDEETGRLLIKFLFRQDEGQEWADSPTVEITERIVNDATVSDGMSKNSVGWSSDNKKLVQRRSKSNLGGNALNKESSLATSSKTDFEEDLNTMIQRSKKYLSIAKLTTRLFEVMITLRMKNGMKKWLNVTNFLLVLPRWEIEKKILSLLEIVDIFKSFVIKSLMNHSMRLLRNKVTTRLKNTRRYKVFLKNGSFSSLSLSRNSDISNQRQKRLEDPREPKQQ